MQNIQQDITIQISYNVLIPRLHISLSVDIGIEIWELDKIEMSDIG